MRHITFLAAALPLLLAGCSDVPTRDMTGPDPAAGPVAVSARGELLARTTCAPCHGENYAGEIMAGGYRTPSLSVVRTYDAAQFDALIVSGIAADGDAVNPLMKCDAVVSLPAADRTLVRRYLAAYVEPY